MAMIIFTVAMTTANSDNTTFEINCNGKFKGNIDNNNIHQYYTLATTIMRIATTFAALAITMGQITHIFDQESIYVISICCHCHIY